MLWTKGNCYMFCILLHRFSYCINPSSIGDCFKDLKPDYLPPLCPYSTF
jgi:hypothetical protein